ncbi:tripartite tricarboxylate transporter TctB family protein [Sporomusa termitida]|uniref:Tripartite tricarboxylate transporter TctB family protein n=1 Tax=Sporomusa termitida TaxID=2377 RepID=A0A517DWY4_9FIRM|nr:tripartite tricarboxylate transporter TctB family protein [Sporomusa termitida]QDR81869.1 Tripartite tricarboxylate transporter TctB family protein [Sporomusa termitida]
MKVKLADRIAGVVAVLIGAMSLTEAIRLYPYRVAVSSGDHLFPLAVGIGLISFGIILAFRGDRVAGFDAVPASKTPVLIFGVPMVLLLYVALIQWTGYSVATFFVSVIFFHWIGLFRWYLSLPAAIVLTASLYLIFVQWLNVPLPSGRWQV